MVAITGLYPNKSGVIYDSPTLQIEFHGISMGGLAVEARVLNAEGQSIGVMAFDVKRADLVYTANPDPYEALVEAIQANIIAQMTAANPYNATFATT